MNFIDIVIRRLEARLIRKLEGYAAGATAARSYRASTVLTGALSALLILGAVVNPSMARADDSAYTEAQAQSGERLYSEHCAACHGVKLEGNGKVPALAGAAFIKRCEENASTVDDLMFFMRSFMPYNEPGKLTKRQYAEITAYLLKANGFAPGTQTLSAEAQTKVAHTTTR